MTLNGVRWALITVTVGLMLGGCGGGGGGDAGGGGNSGGGGNDPSPGFKVSIDRAELRFQGDEGGYIGTQSVLGTSSGSTTATVYTGALDLGTSIDHVTQEIVGTQLKFTVYPKSNLPAGDYRGSLQLFACADDKCARHFSGSPANVPYVIEVRKGLAVSPTTLQLAAVSGATLTRDLSVQLPPGASNMTASSSAIWMSVAVTGAGTVQVTTKPMPPGSYSGTVTVAVSGRTIDVPVNYTVQADATTQTRFTSDVDSFGFTATAGAAAGSRVVNLTLPSWTTELTGEISYDVGANWLSLTKTGDRAYTLTASAADLAPGNYRAQLLLRSGYLTTPLTLPVSLTVGVANWAVSGNTSFTIDATTTNAAPTRTLQINLPGLPAQGWTAVSGAGWLKLLNASGTTGATALQVSLDTTAMLKLNNAASYQADVTISSASGKIAPTKVGFTLTKNLAEVTFASPHLRLPNEAGPLILRGRGFDSLPDLSAALQVTGAQVSNVTRVSDTQLMLQVAGMASGSATFGVTNALGVNSGKASIKVVAPTGYAYKAIDTAGVKGAIVYDDERQSVYTANKTLGTVMRFAYAAGNWTVTAASLPTIESVALSPDGASLLATATSGKIVLFDPATLAVQGSYPLPQGYVRDNTYYSGGRIDGYNLNSSPTLVMANNGKAFFQGSGGIPEAGLAYFDLVSKSYGGIPTPAYNFYAPSGPNLGISGDGSRLLFGFQSNDSQNVMQYMDTADQVIKSNGGGIGYWYDSAQSLHGERISDGSYRVFDKNFSLIGNIVLPDNYYARTSVFSPDGKRLYAIAYNGSAQRVYVLDSSVKLVTTTDLPVLGYVDFADAPTCNDNSCGAWPLATISPDGKTLFIVGEKKLVVLPITATLNATAARAPMQRAKAGAGSVPEVLMPLKLKPR